MSALVTPIAMSIPADRICPKCQTPNEGSALEQRQYRCAGCALELAHLDMAANGAVRGVFGWVLHPGTLVRERYRVAGVLGKGGFGVTYLVDDIHLAGKRRALKEIPELLFDEYETRLLGRLNHPAVPDIIDRFDIDGTVYLVLEFGGSRTLRIELERQGGRIPVFLLLPWIEQVCAALVYLHSQDPPIVHRDLKPENILLDDADRVMLIDFGIAKETTEQGVTRTLGRAVTHGFSPPEQVLGTGTDARSDVYALGAILYCAITGRVPPAAHERITGTVLERPSRFFPDLPPLLDAAICQALELNLHKRQQSVAELAHCLALVHSGSASARTVVGADPVALMAGLSMTQGVHLASVELPSMHQSVRPVTIRSDNKKPLAEPKLAARPRIWLWAGLGLAGVLLASGGNWLYWRSDDRGSAWEAPSEFGTPRVAVPAPGGAPAPTRVGARPGSPSVTSASPANPAADAHLGSAEAPASEISAIPGAAGPEAAAPVAGTSTPGQHELPAGTRAVSADVRDSKSADLTQQPALPPDRLPSVFSDEQRESSGTRPAVPAGSLMDIYEKQREQRADKTPPSMPVGTLDAATKTESGPMPKRPMGGSKSKHQPRQRPDLATTESRSIPKRPMGGPEPKQQLRQHADSAIRKPEPPRRATSDSRSSMSNSKELQASRKFNDW